MHDFDKILIDYEAYVRDLWKTNEYFFVEFMKNHSSKIAFI